MQGEIRIPVPEVPRNCGECGNPTKRKDANIKSYWCKWVDERIELWIDGDSRPPFCPMSNNAIRIPIEKTPADCGDCIYEDCYWCVWTDKKITEWIGIERPPFCPIVVLDDGGE